MLSTVAVTSEQCVVCATVPCDGVTHHTHPMSKQTQKQQGARRVTCVLAQLRAHYTTHALSITKKEKRREKRREEKAESSVRTVEALVSLTLRRATT